MVLLTSKAPETGKTKSATIEAYLKRGARLREMAVSLTNDIERAADQISSTSRTAADCTHLVTAIARPTLSIS